MTDDEIRAAWRQQQEARAFSQATRHRRDAALRGLLRYVAPATLAEVEPEDIEAWLATLRTASTKHAYLSDLRSFYRWARRRRIVASDPTDDVDSVRASKTVPRPIPIEKIRLALSIATERTKTMIMLGAFAGLRVSEIAALDWEDVWLGDLPNVVVRNGKGAKDRIVPMHPELRAHLEEYRKSSGPVIESQHRHLDAGEVGIGSCQVTEVVSTALRAAGVNATAHKLRHTFLTEAAKISQGNMQAVAQLAGHESIQTTAGYVAWAPETRGIVNEMFTEPERRLRAV